MSLFKERTSILNYVKYQVTLKLS